MKGTLGGYSCLLDAEPPVKGTVNIPEYWLPIAPPSLALSGQLASPVPLPATLLQFYLFRNSSLELRGLWQRLSNRSKPVWGEFRCFFTNLYKNESEEYTYLQW